MTRWLWRLCPPFAAWIADRRGNNEEATIQPCTGREQGRESAADGDE